MDRDFLRKSLPVRWVIMEFQVPKFPFLLNGCIPDVIEMLQSQQSHGYLPTILVIAAFHASALISRQPSHPHFQLHPEQF